MSRVLVIAEAGVNHNGDMALARRMVDVAADAGADYVKFQTFDTDSLVSQTAPLAEYQRRNTAGVDSQYRMLKHLELSQTDHYELIEYSARRGIGFLSTAFDIKSVDFLASLNLGIWKIPSGEITNYPYLRRIASYGGKVIMSTGMSTTDDIAAAIDVLTNYGIAWSDITLLHCNTEYPTPPADVNLRAMASIGQRFVVDYGYSDHTLGIEVPIAAVALGASVIEKHFTLDRSLPGPDQAASLTPDELKAMVAGIRVVEEALGTSDKRITDSERHNIAVARKSIVASQAIARGEILTDENITARRPGTGLSPMLWPQVVGTPAVRDFAPGDLIEL